MVLITTCKLGPCFCDRFLLEQVTFADSDDLFFSNRLAACQKTSCMYKGLRHGRCTLLQNELYRYVV